MMAREMQYEKLSHRIKYDESIFINRTNYKKVLNELLDDAESIALAHLYPYDDYYEMSLPNKYLNWQIRACCELFDLADKSSIISYSENGLSWTRLSDGLSKSLMNELIAHIGVPKRKEVEIEDVDKDTAQGDGEENV